MNKVWKYITEPKISWLSFVIVIVVYDVVEYLIFQ